MKLRTICLISTLALGLFAAALPAEAQQAGKVYRIGYPGGGRSVDVLRQRLRELGYVEGQNLVIEHLSVSSKPGPLGDRAPDMAAELMRLKVDLIVARPRVMIHALQKVTRTIPIVMRGVNVDPVKAGFVESLARPGGNITGLTAFESDLHPKRLELLKEAFPRISRVAILWPRGQQKAAIKEIQALAQALGIQIQSVRATSAIESAFSAIGQERADSLLVAHSRPARIHRARIIEFTAERRLPTIFVRSLYVKDGGLMSYGTDANDLTRRAATYVTKILKGEKPGDLPIEQPTKFNFIINLKTAKALGLTIPPEVLLQATRVIK